MTICAALAGPDRAIAWADTMCFRGDAPAGHIPKLRVNPLARMVAVGCGVLDILTAAERAFLRAEDLDELAGCVSAALRRAVVRIGHVLDRMPDDPLTTFAAAGWSRRYRRFAVVTWSSESLFVPRWGSAMAAPPVPGQDDAACGCPHAVLSAAREQMRLLRDDVPAAAGRVTVAEVSAGGIHVWRPFDVDTGRAAWT